MEYTNGDKYQVKLMCPPVPRTQLACSCMAILMLAKMGTCLQGDTLGDLRHGKGTHTCSNGDIYKGYWRLDKRHGRGKVTLANGMQYEGDWVNDRAHG